MYPPDIIEKAINDGVIGIADGEVCAWELKMVA